MRGLIGTLLKVLKQSFFKFVLIQSQARCEHLEEEKRTLYEEAQKQALVIDEQNEQISTLTSNLKQIGVEGKVPDLPQLTSSKLLTDPTSKVRVGTVFSLL